MRLARLLVFFIVVGCVCGRAAAPPVPTYSGSLSSATGGIDGREGWINPGPTTIAWEVTDHTTYWHYKYTLTVPASEADVSHFIIEVSDNFDVVDFYNATGPFTSTQIGDFTQLNGNPNIPDTVHGLKFDNVTGTTVVFEFDSLRLPVWGDFYAKCGGNPPNEAWNTGLTASDTDPDDPPDDGSVEYHLLVPDSLVPEPATLALVAVGAAGLLGIRRRR